ncbi:FRG domain-containing protein [Aeromonas salmonicida]|uniref:FRG domain-containing protein n=1 Tax=Aeromonas salmonicida TaxID=645 RepID=UPI003D1F8BB8
MNQHVVNTLSEYISVTSRIARENESMWFRGVSSAAHRLVPSVLRDTIQLTDGRGGEVRPDQPLNSGGGLVTGLSPEEMFNDFKIKAVPFLEQEPKNDFEWMFLMQHYGVPTRLLDWTTNALIALYFAIESEPSNQEVYEDEYTPIEDYLASPAGEFSEHAAAVFALSPIKFNELASDVNSVIPISWEWERWSSYIDPMNKPAGLNNILPIAISPSHIDNRIRAQSGYFTLHGSNIWPIDYYDAVRRILTKIMIPYKVIPGMVRDLEAVGITDSLVFPDLSGLAKQVRRKGYHKYKS